jgi:hypothetical protein
MRLFVNGFLDTWLAPHGLVGGAGALQAAIDAARKAASEHEDHALNRTRTPVKGEGDDLW